MIKEVYFATVLYDEQKRTIRCSRCGKPVAPGNLMGRVAGWWIRRHCVFEGYDMGRLSETALCSTLLSLAER